MKIGHLVVIPFMVVFLLLSHPAAYAVPFTFSTLPGTGLDW